jgi:hypothetical protein
MSHIAQLSKTSPTFRGKFHFFALFTSALQLMASFLYFSMMASFRNKTQISTSHLTSLQPSILWTDHVIFMAHDVCYWVKHTTLFTILNDLFIIINCGYTPYYIIHPS